MSTKAFLSITLATCLLLVIVRPKSSQVGTVCQPCSYLSPNFAAQLQGALRQRNQTVLTAQEYGSACCALAGYTNDGAVQVFANPKLISQKGFHSALMEDGKLFVLYNELCFSAEQELCVKDSLAAAYTIAFSMLEGFNRSLNRVL